MLVTINIPSTAEDGIPITWQAISISVPKYHLLPFFWNHCCYLSTFSSLRGSWMWEFYWGDTCERWRRQSRNRQAEDSDSYAGMKPAKWERKNRELSRKCLRLPFRCEEALVKPMGISSHAFRGRPALALFRYLPSSVFGWKQSGKDALDMDMVMLPEA